MAISPFLVTSVQSYKARKKNELSFKVDQVILVTKSNVKEFLYFGKLDGREGWFPYFYVKAIPKSNKNQFKQFDKVKPQSPRSPYGPYTKQKAKKDKHNGKSYIMKEGMLEIQLDQPSSILKRRFVVLRPNKLAYYYYPTDKKPDGKFSVKHIKHIRFAIVASKKLDRFCFTIVTKRKETILFAAETKEDCDDWIQKINNAMSGGKVSLVERLANSNTKEEKEDNNNAAFIQGRQKTLEQLQIRLRTGSNSGLLRQLKRLKLKSVDTKSTSSSEEVVLEKIIFPEKQPIGRVRVNYNYIGSSEMELTIRKNDEIALLDQTGKRGWWLGRIDHREGYFPAAYVTVIEVFEKNPTNESEDIPLSTPRSIGVKKKEERKVSILENFQIGERIGKGQYGSVYRGINIENGEMVAIKQVGAAKMNKSELANIMGELELLKELDHPNILKYKGFIKTKEHINIVLDFVEGGSLQSIIGKFGVIPERLAICYIKQILHGLQYLHARDVIHRDIKCGNILVTKDGSIKLADFGIATKLGDKQGPAAGSPYWMAPEVIEHISSGPPCDIWALGCTIIELLTGSPPYFELNQMAALFSMVENERPPFPNNISPEMESFLSQCFIRDPMKRATARSLKRHALVNDGEEPEFKELDHLENLNDIDLVALSELDAYGVLDGLIDENTDLSKLLGDISISNLDNSFDELNDSAENTELNEIEIVSDGNLDYLKEQTVSQEDLEFFSIDEIMQELLNSFHEAMDEKDINVVISLRKSVRAQLPSLTENQDDPRFKILLEQAIMSMDRCEDEMGKHIPIDSDED